MFTTESPRVAKKRQVKTEGIVDAAIRLVEAGGLESLTIHKLAAELELTAGALYRYFPSMDALHAELQRRIIREYHDALAPLLDGDPADPLAGLFVAAEHYTTYFLAHRGRLAVIAQSLADPRRLLSDEAFEHVVSAVVPVLDHIRAMLDQARKDRDLSTGDAAERTMIYWSLLQGLMQLHKMDRLGLSAARHEELVTAGVRTLLTGWGAEPRRVSLALRRAEKRLQDRTHTIDPEGG
ncbi:TetR/AcrR family transcriptional regulator [Myxococcota bacterium]|nr:TetR/AcrR family transcriptional regulator [Myxococcota bacterium]